MTPPPTSDTRTAFENARKAVSEHTDKMAVASATWREETATELVLANTFPTIRFADFNRGEEAETGADWLWWWVAPSGEAFGSLVQAKKLTFTDAGTPKIDWRHSRGRQYGDLNRAATHLGVPALYAIYFGGLDYRSD